MDIKNKRDYLLNNYREIKKNYESKVNNYVNVLNGEQEREYKKVKRKIDVIDKGEIEMYDEEEIKKVFNQCNNNEFLVMAIRNGYLNDSVSDYINYFYSEFLDNHDNEFRRNLYAGNKLDATYELHDSERMYNELQEVYFSTEPIVNYDLIKYCLCEKYNDNKTERLCNVIIANCMLIFDIINYSKEG